MSRGDNNNPQAALATGPIGFADLVDKAFDAGFDEALPENGSFHKQFRRGREYRYYLGYDAAEGGGRRRMRYVGPVSSPGITVRVERFGRLKTDFLQRRELASRLRRVGLPTPDPTEGVVIAALGRAGLFRLRATLVGSVAYQAYGGLLGLRLPEAQYRTQDLDVAQFHGVAIHLDDAMPDVGAVLGAVDPTFASIFNPDSPGVVGAYGNAGGFKVEFLTPNRGAAGNERTMVALPALGASALRSCAIWTS